MKISKKITYFLAKISVTTLCFVYIFNNINFSEVLNASKDINYRLIMWAVFVLIIQVFLASYRWFIINKHISVTFTKFRQLLRYVWIGLFFNQVLPSSVGGDFIRGYYLCKFHQVKTSEAIFSVFIDRVIGLLALLFLSTIALQLLPKEVSNKFPILDYFFLSWLFIFILINIDKWEFLNKHIFTKLRKYLTYFVLLREMLYETLIGVFNFIISMFIHVLTIIVFFIISLAMGIEIKLLDLFIVIPFAILLMALPLSFAGWGIREGIIVFGFNLFGLPSHLSLTLSLIYGFLVLAVSLFGAMVWIKFNKNE